MVDFYIFYFFQRYVNLKRHSTIFCEGNFCLHRELFGDFQTMMRGVYVRVFLGPQVQFQKLLLHFPSTILV